MTSPTCLSCHRQPEPGSHRCRHHNVITTHLMLGFPALTTDIEHIPHLRARWRNKMGYIVVIRNLHTEHATPCQSIHPELYFDGWKHLSRADQANLEQLCLSCPVLEHCREVAIAHQEHGFQGGMTPGQRASVRTLRGQLLNSFLNPSACHPEYRHGYWIRSGS